ncbi:MAG: hypothetical protein IJY57_00135 [Clostridia bacterium]|nr:hypothetical protein [Clostridia bacterium]
MKSKLLAISAVSASFIAVFLTLGAYIEFVDLISVVIASIFVLLPLYLKSYKGSLLAFLAGGLLAFLISGFNILSLVFPAYFVFFGVYPIVRNKLLEKNLNKYLFIVIGLIWCVATCFGLYFYYTAFMGIEINDLPEVLAPYILPIVAVIGIVLYFVYDRFIWIAKITIDRYLSKIIK